MFQFFSKSSSSVLGIDIGTSSIKIVEISGGSEIVLENYGEIFMRDFVGKVPVKGTEGTFLYSTNEIADAIKHLISEADIKTKRAYFAMPDFVSFFTSFNLPPMKKEEIDSAVEFHSRQYIPLPISEVTLDWFLAGGEEGKDMKINLVAVPNEVIEQYQEIARLAGLDIVALEGEMFGLIRAYTHSRKGVVAVADMGEQSTLLTIAENGVLKTTHSLEIAGNMLIEQVAKAGELEYNKAREVVMTHGLEEPSVKGAVSSLATSLFSEMIRVIKIFEKKEGKEVEEIIIAGGFSMLPGVVDYAKESIDKEVVTKNCFEGLKYPKELESYLKRISPSHVIALGAALSEAVKKNE